MQMLERDGLTCPTYRNCLEYPPRLRPHTPPRKVKNSQNLNSRSPPLCPADVLVSVGAVITLDSSDCISMLSLYSLPLHPWWWPW